MKTLITITGPSLSGKTTLETLLKERGCQTLVSCTTRPMRAGEVEGQAYYFQTKEQFSFFEENGLLVESVRFNGNSYGMMKSEFDRLKDSTMPVVVVVEPHGRDQLIAYARSIGWKTGTVWINSPNAIPARFKERFQKDILKEVQYGDCTVESVSRIVTVHADREKTAQRTEAKWVEESLTYPYTKRIQEFNEQNCHQTVQDLLYIFAPDA